MTRIQPTMRAKAVALDEYVDRVVAAAPPLTDQQRAQLAELLRPARRTGQPQSKVVAA
ncbi:hypothetical protein MCNF_26720 [Mycolicibacterium confluentis]|uniref:PhiRv1 phage protein n=1 Tax=Mycolicibacterium confluentis TaxID=28047 RepID=A0A7I7XXR6_9MYCO|nr:hypothetical protein [Mycolicibacterium confluentis]MCV7318393.1 hypothetical protein [Mycolicibacterium confluentis]BBZ34067.1 hypothetical protein MCNF_26720 [Mycolicibacterium confluentis]